MKLNTNFKIKVPHSNGAYIVKVKKCGTATPKGKFRSRGMTAFKRLANRK